MARRASTTHQSVDQLELFDCFGAPIACETGTSPQAAFASNDSYQDDDDDPLVTTPVIRRVVQAATASPLRVSGPASIFDMANTTPLTVRMERKSDVQQFTRVERSSGTVRCVRILEQDTSEWQQREAARRARQRPPKPTAKAKTKSRKLLDMVGV